MLENSLAQQKCNIPKKKKKQQILTHIENHPVKLYSAPFDAIV